MDVEALIVNMHSDLAKKVDEGFGSISKGMTSHEVEDTRRFGKIDGDIRELQTDRMTVRWFIGIVVVAMLGGVVEHVMNHGSDKAPIAAVHAAEKGAR